MRSETANPQPEWEYAVAYTMHTYRTRLDDINRHGKPREKAAEIDFPQTIEEYRLKPKEIQHRAARFLVLETDEQREKMMSEFGWFSRLVNPLKAEFNASQVCFFFCFCEHFFIVFVKEFQEEVRATVVELNVGDPRKR